MPFSPRSAIALPLAAAIVSVALGRTSTAIEMFTNFGDGSRIGLPSLEVPIEAYPGIPLRSDRIRARRGWRSQLSQPRPVRPPAPAARGSTPGTAPRPTPPGPTTRGPVASPASDPEPLRTPAGR